MKSDTFLPSFYLSFRCFFPNLIFLFLFFLFSISFIYSPLALPGYKMSVSCGWLLYRFSDDAAMTGVGLTIRGIWLFVESTMTGGQKKCDNWPQFLILCRKAFSVVRLKDSLQRERERERE